MNKKIIGIIIAVIIVFVTVFSTISFSSKKTVSSNSKREITISKEVSIKYAFADVDFDQMIQEVDSKDEDTKADYVFIKFTGAIVPKKVEKSILGIENYKLDGKPIPTGSEILVDSKNGNSLLIIKLPNGTFKNKNNGHTLEIAKDININGETKITGDFKFSLPYSKKQAPVKDEKKESTKNNTSQNNKPVKENTSPTKATKNDVKNNPKDTAKDTTIADKNIPKYTIELGKGIPLTTIVLVRLDTKDVEKFKVSVDGVDLKIRTDSKKRKVFIGSIKKDYSLDEVENLLNISKVK
ncbi:hypothetical protein [Clostridium sp. ZS2-4]|uniref:hypothetical protein n=1 Tax=Clostridium sp. ZS2-4 TaxID=2987703 RepID=UPI00227A5502|nr:hypothetical protein [Clostridium sp. ZS2-4]MCY6355123.1 hypothetical protein [Clostridium sp. ZS2-4]